MNLAFASGDSVIARYISVPVDLATMVSLCATCVPTRVLSAGAASMRSGEARASLPHGR